MEELKKYIRSFYPFAKEKMGFNKPPTIFLKQNEDNAKNILGKTAYYDPEAFSITLFITGRHPKDILRSLAHELVHHTQNCQGEFDNAGEMGEGYAQTNPHLREMEIAANRDGSMCLRDWEDLIKHGGKQTMAMNESKLREAIRTALNQIMKEGTLVDNPEKAEEAEAAEEEAEKAGGQPGAVYKGSTNEGKHDTEKKDIDESVQEDVDVDVQEEVEGEELEEGGRASRRENEAEGEERRMKTSSAMREEKETPLQEWYQNELYDKLVESFVRK